MENRKQTDGGRWRLVAGVLALVSLGLLAAVLVLAVNRGGGDMKDDNKDMNPEPKPMAYKMCGPPSEESNIDTSEAQSPEMYDDLTMNELKSIQNYMYGLTDMKLVKPSKAKSESSYIFISDLYPPAKSEALDYLAGNGPKPDRVARLLVFRGDASPPVVEEYLVGPLPTPTWHRLYTNTVRKNPVPYGFRPIGGVESDAYFLTMYPEVDRKIGHILQKHYGSTFTNCGDKCLTFYTAPAGSGVTKEKKRQIWLISYQFVEYYSLHPIDLMLLTNLDSSDPTKWFVSKLLFGGKEYSSLDDLALKYNTTSIPLRKAPFPGQKRDLFSSMNRRGKSIPGQTKRPPRLVEPDGKRYSLKHRTVEYMQWKFTFRMSTLNGPQVYDVRFNNERIAYEVGLQEIAVFYGANNSATRSADFIDSGELIGTHSQSLVPGADCPETSTFVDMSYLGENSDDNPIRLDRAFCLFELNTGIPLRRHLSYSVGEGGFYGGISDNAFILRSIITIVNYDYVMDFIFHQSGALEVRAISTGYIFTSFYTPEESPYGFKLQDNILGNIHHHMFLFKADIDIHGTSNRYESLDISAEEVPNEQTTGKADSTYFQLRFDKNLKKTESEAAYKYNFDLPKYHLVHNANQKTDQGEIKAYRVHVSGMTKQLLQENSGNEPLVAWSRYQMAVTKYKEEERYGTSCYGLFDSMEPTVNFTTFHADNENLVDEDLVMWIPMGTVHIPHTEDLATTPTVGAHLSFSLLPYNYFKECPSSQSRDAIRVEYKDQSRPKDGVRVERNGYEENQMCIVHSPDYDKEVKDRPEIALERP